MTVFQGLLLLTIRNFHMTVFQGVTVGTIGQTPAQAVYIPVK